MHTTPSSFVNHVMHWPKWSHMTPKTANPSAPNGPVMKKLNMLFYCLNVKTARWQYNHRKCRCLWFMFHLWLQNICKVDDERHVPETFLCYRVNWYVFCDCLNCKTNTQLQTVQRRIRWQLSDTCRLSNRLQQNALANAKLNSLVRRCESIQTQIDTVQESVGTQRNHRTKQIAQDLDGLQPDHTATEHTCTHVTVFYPLSDFRLVLDILSAKNTTSVACKDIKKIKKAW